MSTVSNLQTYAILLYYYYYKKTKDNKCYFIDYRERKIGGRHSGHGGHGGQGGILHLYEKIKIKKIKIKRKLHGPVVFCLVQRVHRVHPTDLC